MSIGGTRVKSVASHLTVTDLAQLAARGASNAGPLPIPTLAPGAAVEADRVISPAGIFALGGQILVGAAILAGRQVSGSNPHHAAAFGLDTRTLLRTRPNPLSPEQVVKLRGP